ncbi:MAG: hypothetical protein MUE73_07215 [Planctomycetes bacterium]|jgi:hypothetical protein|nr:hypothetical protein [Planctomycetota bacterium]
MIVPRVALAAVAVLAVAAASGCYCPKCPVDTADGIAVSTVSILSSAERGALFGALGFVTAECGPESPEVRALDIALSGNSTVVGRFQPTRDSMHVRGYALLKDGRLALDDRLVRAAPPDAQFLADPATWPLIPFLYAAGYRMAHGGTWEESNAAAHAFADQLAKSLDQGRHAALLPPGVEPWHLAKGLRSWQRMGPPVRG